MGYWLREKYRSHTLLVTKMLHSWVIIAHCTANINRFTVCVGIVNLIHIPVMVCTFTDQFFERVLYFPTWKLVVGALELSVSLSSSWHVTWLGSKAGVESSWDVMAHMQKPDLIFSVKRTSQFKSAGASVQSTDNYWQPRCVPQQ
jgi:hypothetical protein